MSTLVLSSVQPGSPSELQLLVDVLLPGDSIFPPASAAGSHGLLAERLRQLHGPEFQDRLEAALLSAAGGVSLGNLSDDGRTAAVRVFEQQEPLLFTIVRTALYYSYYQSPMVIRAVRMLGYVYNDAPQPLGYAMRPFDPQPGADAPVTPRGTYKKTAEIERIDLSALETGESASGARS